MTQYRTKTVVIEAHQWHKNGDHPLDFGQAGREGSNPEQEGLVVRYFRSPDDNGSRTCEKCGNIMHNHGWIDAPKGGHVVCPGDWIITGVAGEHYPCNPSIFAATYEAV